MEHRRTQPGLKPPGSRGWAANSRQGWGGGGVRAERLRRLCLQETRDMDCEGACEPAQGCTSPERVAWPRGRQAFHGRRIFPVKREGSHGAIQGEAQPRYLSTGLLQRPPGPPARAAGARRRVQARRAASGLARQMTFSSLGSSKRSWASAPLSGDCPHRESPVRLPAPHHTQGHLRPQTSTSCRGPKAPALQLQPHDFQGARAQAPAHPGGPAGVRASGAFGSR